MDIKELKGVNQKILAGRASSATNMDAILHEKKTRRKPNQAFCEFDIVAAYEARKGQRPIKPKSTKEHTKSRKTDKVEKSQLCKKIEDLTARNEQIKLLLESSQMYNKPECQTPKDAEEEAKHVETGKTRERRRHREHKNRRFEHYSSTHNIEPNSNEKHKFPKGNRDNQQIKIIKVRDNFTSKDCDDNCKEQQKEVGLAGASYENKTGSTRSPKITVRLKNNQRTDKELKNNCGNNQNPEWNCPDAKSQLVRVTNYQTKSKSVDRKYKDNNDAKNEVITVYKNTNILEETDSIMSRDTLKKSKTQTLMSSYTRQHSNLKRDAILEIQQPKVETQADVQELMKPGKLRDNAKQIEIPHIRNTSPVKTLSPRKELSFSNLNLQPNIYHYASPARIATTQTSVSRIETPGFGTQGVNVSPSYIDNPEKASKDKRTVKDDNKQNYLTSNSGHPQKWVPPSTGKESSAKTEILSQTAIALRDIMQVQELEQKFHNTQHTFKTKFSENTSFVSSDSSRRPRPSLKGCLSKNTRFHKPRSDPPRTDRVVEIASKTFQDQKVTFSVEGVEPPHKLKNAKESSKSMKKTHVFNLQVFPGITITENNVKGKDISTLNHGIDKVGNMNKFKPKATNESLRTLNESDSYYPFMRNLGYRNSEFKPKESSEVSYKFRKKCWSNKELPKKKTKEKKKKKTKVLKSDMAVQTGLDDLEVQGSKGERNIAVSTSDCDWNNLQLFKEAQIQVALPEIKDNSDCYSVQARRSSQSESNVTVAVLKERLVRTNEVEVMKKQQLVKENLNRRDGPKHNVDISCVQNVSCGGENVFHKVREPLKPQPRKQRPEQKHRKSPQVTTHVSRNPQPVMSTGSIKQEPQYAKKTRSKSLTHDRDYLVEKININKETIRHHHQEIAALEKCLNEILQRLKQDDSVSKIANKGDNTNTESEVSKLNSCSSAGGNDVVCKSQGDTSSIKSNGTYIVTNPSVCKKVKKYKSKYKGSRRQMSSKSKTALSKFQRGKAYSERLKKRYKKFKDNVNGSRPYVTEVLVKPTVKVRSVYKNMQSFVSSASSLSSKISDLGSSSTYPQSIPSVNVFSSMAKPICNEPKQQVKVHRRQQGLRQGIVKKKNKLLQHKAKYSKKKTESIYDMLMQYINLTNDGECQGGSVSASIELSTDQSKIVFLSVSSVKVKETRKTSQCQKQRNVESTKQAGSDLVVGLNKMSPISRYSNKPFYIGNRRNIPSLPKEKTLRKQTLNSEDSLEYDTQSRTPDLCPLTAIFNFQPPKKDFLVYNTEVFTANKPKIEFKSAATGSVVPRGEEGNAQALESLGSAGGSKLMTIQEEKVVLPNVIPPDKTLIGKENSTNLSYQRKFLVADLSPILSRKAYPSYSDVIKSLEDIDMPGSPKKDPKMPAKPKLTTFNCNDRECSNLIFNYTSKKDRDRAESMPKDNHSWNSKPASFSCDRHESSAYHTLTTIMDSKSPSLLSPSDSDTAIKNESGYESSKKSSSFRKFFKKKTLMDVFRSKLKKKSSECGSIPENLELVDDRSPACIISEQSLGGPTRSEYEGYGVKIDDKQEDVDVDKSPYSQSKTVLWFNFRKKKKEAGQGCDPWCVYKDTKAAETDVPSICSRSCHKETKCISTNTGRMAWAKNLVKTECPCSLPFEQQREQCKKYASKVLMEAAERQKGYSRQYENFEEMPLKVLMASKNCPCAQMNQGCAKSFANKSAGIQVKQPKKSEPVQVDEVHVDEVHVDEVQVDEGPVVPAARPMSSFVPTPTAGSPSPMPSIPSPRASELLEMAKALPPVTYDIVDDPSLVANEEASSMPSPSIASSTRQSTVSNDNAKSIYSYTDKEIFERLLNEYERRDAIAERLSTDDVFYDDAIEAANSGVVPDLQVQADDTSKRGTEERMRGPRFTDRPEPLVQVTKDGTVRPDDIGTCFARGFRPDNLMLSGDACFHINKQDKAKMSPYMLKNTESIIDFSERETPLDFLLALGFMVDEASNALKDDDIRSRLLAAITEARVWINKITTTQGTLLYLVAYKARPETMRYFLQLVEAIINKRINNAIRLDGFLRVLEDVESGRVQMINILGEDKFEDEENEEKLVKKQLKSLFINVYTVAEKEASVSGRSLTPMQVSLLRILVAKYRAGLHPHLELIARYIGQGLLENEIQLEAAMIFLSRLDTSEVKLKEFENYCGITCQLQDT